MKKTFINMIAVTGALCGASRAAGFDPFTETKKEYNARAQWLRDAKFGALVSWNPSSLTGQEMSWDRDKVGREKYDALYKEFKGEEFNAGEWVRLFHEAGIRYAVVVPRHCDGFCMFDTKTTDYNVMHSPFGRDYVKEMADACARSDVRFCLYYSILDWWNPIYSDKAGADLTKYKNEVFKPHIRELLTKYGPVGCIWFDGHWDPSWTHADGREMYGFIRKIQPATLLGNRIDQRATANGAYCRWTGSFFNGAPDPVGDYQAREMNIGKFYMDKAWDNCYDLSYNGWSWTPPMRIRPTKDVLGWLIQCIGRDGGMLLGIGPRPDGTIEPAQAATLMEIGDWMKLNGEAVYGTRGGPYLPGYWGVSTRKGDKVFLSVTGWRKNALMLPALPAKVKSARLVSGGPVRFEEKGDGWTLRVPEQFHRPAATIIELTLNRRAMTLPVVDVPEPKSLSQVKPVTASGEWPGRADIKKENVNDGDFETIWSGPDKSRDGWVQIDLGEERTVDAALLDDGPYYTQRCEKFEVQAQIAGEWKTLAAGTDIGNYRHLMFEPTKARLFRVVITPLNDVGRIPPIEAPRLSEFQLFEKLEN